MPNLFESALTRYLTPEQLALIRTQRIGLAGAGGLGSNIAVILTRTGFSHFEITDRDVVDPSNLNRQDYILSDIGKPKVAVLKERLLAINPEANVIIHQNEWPPQKADLGFQDATVLIEAFDRAQIKRDFVEWASRQNKVVVSGNGMAGLTGGDPTAVRKIGNVYIVGDARTSIEDGHAPLAPRVLQCAARMAEIVLRLTLRLPVT